LIASRPAAEATRQEHRRILAATIALEMVGPIARTLIKRSTHPCPQQEPIAALSLAPEAQLHRG